MEEGDVPITVREARDRDAEQLVALIESCWSEYPDIVVAVELEAPEVLRIESAFRRLGGKFWVMEQRERIIGSVGVVPSAEPGGVELRKLYVAQDLRRRGLGAQLCGLVEGEAMVRTAGFIDLWSDTRFTDAHRLYERLGFVRSQKTRELKDLSNTIEIYFRKSLRARQ